MDPEAPNRRGVVGLTLDDLQRMPKMPVYLKKRDMIQLNQVEQYQDSCESAWLEDTKMADSRDFDVFISNNQQDKSWVSKSANELEAQGVHAWFDEANLAIGDRYAETLAGALRAAKVVAVVVGPNYVTSYLPPFELGAAVAASRATGAQGAVSASRGQDGC